MPFTPTDYLPYDFANRRHIGPSPSEMGEMFKTCLLYTSPSPRDLAVSRMPSSA